MLFGLSVVTWNRRDLEELQRVENRVWRCILGAPGFTAIGALRGDIGVLSVGNRDMKVKLAYARFVMERNSSALVKRILEDMYSKGTDKWVKLLRVYMEKVGILDLDDLTRGSELQLKKRIEEYDKLEWRQSVTTKSTLKLYEEFKEGPKKELIYDNTFESGLLFRARSDTLDLRWRKRFQGEDVMCPLCGEEEETLQHYILKCSYLATIRQQFDIQGRELEEVLLFKEGFGVENSKNYLGAIWRKRKARLKELGSL